jgi:hypothetical protein
MIEFIRSIYRGFVTIGFWVILIGFTVGGGIVGNALSGWGSNYTAGGVVLGLIIGFIIDILLCGFVATIVNIDENIEQLRRNMKQSSSPSQGNTSGYGSGSIIGGKFHKKCAKCHKDVDEGYSACPHCGSKTFE